ncbi:MAG TPA: hypothetical protein VF705_09715, partial [Longimicrobium sp.]
RSADAAVGTITVYFTSWFDLDVFMGKDVVLSAPGLGLDSRLHDGHHQIRCLRAGVSSHVSISTNPPEWVKYDVTCKHDQGTAN